MVAAVVPSAQSVEMNGFFHLEGNKEIISFFSEHKGDKREALKASVKRIEHYLHTGVWVTERKLCEYAATHPGVSSCFAGTRLERKLLRYERGTQIPKSSLRASLKKTFGFLKEYIRDPQTVGSLFPSSKYLAKEIVSKIPKDPKVGGRRILEIGPGTGVFTDRIIKRMNPSDTLDLVEFDEKFCAQLRERYRNLPNVRVFQKSILDHEVQRDRKYNYVVSGLPLNSFSVEMVRKIFEKFEELTARDGYLSYFDYLFLPAIKRVGLNKEEKQSFDAILSLKERFFEKRGEEKNYVMRNLFPARVLHHIFVG